MVVCQQKIHRIWIRKLKNISDLDLSLDGHLVTAILGPNGSGKSTVLHALAAAFKPNIKGEDYRFSDFFLPHTDALWEGSELSIEHTYRVGPNEHRVTTSYAKRKDRWAPRYESRPQRDVFYVGINEYVPRIEVEKSRVRVKYSTFPSSDPIDTEILEAASQVFNKKYTQLNTHRRARGGSFIGVVTGTATHSALSMSAGEQKVFYILDKLYRAKKNALLLIDEYDLLLHEGALSRLTQVVCNKAKKEAIQVVFTTHRESIASQSSIINIRHFVKKSEKTYCFSETKPDAIRRLTESSAKPLEIFVEDDLADAVVRQVSLELGLSRYVAVHSFGAAQNCFTVIGGMLLSGEECHNCIFVLDGDKFRDPTDKMRQIERVITGNGEKIEEFQKTALSKITDLALPDGYSPERYLHEQIKILSESPPDNLEDIIALAASIEFKSDSHDYINGIVAELGMDRRVCISKIVAAASQTAGWKSYTSTVRSWLEIKKTEVQEDFE